MSPDTQVLDSAQKIAEHRRELERRSNDREIEFKKAQSSFFDTQREWQNKINEAQGEIDKATQKVEAWKSFVENQRHLASIPEEKVLARTAALEKAVTDAKVKKNDLNAQAEVALRPLVEAVDRTGKEFNTAKKALDGLKEYESLFNEKPAEEAKP